MLKFTFSNSTPRLSFVLLAILDETPQTTVWIEWRHLELWTQSRKNRRCHLLPRCKRLRKQGFYGAVLERGSRWIQVENVVLVVVVAAIAIIIVVVVVAIVVIIDVIVVTVTIVIATVAIVDVSIIAVGMPRLAVTSSKRNATRSGTTLVKVILSSRVRKRSGQVVGTKSSPRSLGRRFCWHWTINFPTRSETRVHCTSSTSSTTLTWDFLLVRRAGEWEVRV